MTDNQNTMPQNAPLLKHSYSNWHIMCVWQDAINGFMGDIIPRLLPLLQSGEQYVQENAIVALSHIAKSCKEQFLDYHSEVRTDLLTCCAVGNCHIY